MKNIIKSEKIVVVLVSIIMLLSFAPFIPTSYADDSKEPVRIETQEEAVNEQKSSRSGSAPHLKSGVNWKYTATGIVGVQYGFSDNWLEYFFEDADNDNLDFYVSINDGTYTQSGITYLVDENNDPVTTFVYTPSSNGLVTIKIYAYDGTNYSSDYIRIKLYVEDANSSNVVYTTINVNAGVSDFTLKDSSNTVVSIGSGTSSGGVTTYSTTLNKGTYTFEGKPVNSNQLSGMSFTVPTTAGAGTSSNPDNIYIKQANVKVKANNVAQQTSKYDITLRDADMETVTPGLDTNDDTNVPYLVFANGNAELYSFEVTPTDSSLSGYATLYQGNQTFAANTTAQSVNLTLPTAINYLIKVPSDATLSVYRQIRNYQTIKLDNGTPTTSGDYKTYTYKLPKNGSGYTYRLTKTGCITKAGFLSLSASNQDDPLEVSFDSGAPGLTLAQAIAAGSGYNTSTSLGSRAEDSVLLNAHTGENGNYSALYHNYINLGVGHSYKIRGYRAAWQIINNDTANIMIEPDFHFQVVEGTASDLTLTQDSVHNSWCTVTPNTGASGVYVIKVTYDAIDVDGMSYSNNIQQRFYATATGREGYIVINVDSSKYTDMALNAETNGSRDANMDWDSEIDTVYYTGTQGTFTFAPTTAGKTISTVEFSTTPGTYSTIIPSNGKYTVNPVQGYNMIKVTWNDNTVSYAPIRAAQVKILVDGNELTSNTTVSSGSSHTIRLEGVYIPVPKFSGIYNPMMNKVNYTVGDSTVSGNNLQYNFITQNTITWTPASAGTYNFTNGYHSMRMFCNTTAKWGHHRLLTDAGVGANFNAGLVNGVFNIYPDFSIIVS